ncbi:GMC family oxidoreductase (plasmid) [Thioclava sp. 'Guangxiensis']|uniref:GMC family oxidoreductase n=1 Tax=Thioclava sp. 'Guangxiensis' TaxID=3149044 RepID=UPI0032C441EA
MKTSSQVVIVGTGVIGAVIAEECLDAGLEVLMIEAGPRVSRSEIVERYRNLPLGLKPSATASYFPTEMAPHPFHGLDYLQSTGPDNYNPTYVRYAGGSTWHWAGTCWRLTPEDMQLNSLYGVGRDWAIGYEDLDPYYNKTELALGICGPSDPADQWPQRPRSMPYPMPHLPMSQGEQKFTQVVRDSLGLRNLPVAQARNSGTHYHDRPACCSNNNCVPVCPVGAKYDAATALKRLEAKGATILDNSVVYRVETTEKNRIAAIHYYDSQRQTHRVTGEHFVIACNGIETPKLMLMSADDRNPNGLANSSDQVGRNIMDHPQQGYTLTTSEPYWLGQGPVVNSGIMETSQGDFRSEHAGAYFRMNNFARNRYISQRAMKSGKVGRALDEEIRRLTACTVAVVAAYEMLPDPNNRLTLSQDKDWLGLPKPSVYWDVGDYTRRSSRDYGDPMVKRIADAIGATDFKSAGMKFAPSKHLMGGTIMGRNASDSVVDTVCRAHDHDNLYLPGGGAMASTACGNSTITMTSLAFRASEALISEAKGA